MANKNISITPTSSKHTSCGLCLVKNYQTEQSRLGGPEAYILDLYDLKIGSQSICLCAQCLGKIRMKIGKALENRNLPTVDAIVKGSDFRLEVVEGNKGCPSGRKRLRSGEGK